MDIAMLYRDEPHPAHAGFAKFIDADLVSLNEYSLADLGLTYSIPEELFNGIKLPKYDVYIAEGTRALYGSLMTQLKTNSILIYLVGDMSLYKLSDRSYKSESLVNWLISRFGMRTMKYIFNKYIDGCIAVSGLSRESAENIMPAKPIRVAHPYIQPDLYNKLNSRSPNLGSKIAITVGSYSKYKGQDLLVDAWQSVRNEHPDARLYLVGNDYPESFEQLLGIEVLGYVDDLPKTLAKSSLYVQPSRVNNFPVSVLEALRAGLPAVVTNTTGNSTVVEQLGYNMVVEPSPTAIASGITRYFNLSSATKEELSSKAKKLGSKFDAESRKSDFRSEFNQLMKEIE